MNISYNKTDKYTNVKIIFLRTICHNSNMFRSALVSSSGNVMFEFPYIVSLYYIRNQQDATLAVSFISHCKITLCVSDAFCVHHQEH